MENCNLIGPLDGYRVFGLSREIKDSTLSFFDTYEEALEYFYELECRGLFENIIITRTEILKEVYNGIDD